MKKKDSYWFRHDSTAGRGLKMRKMAHVYGHWGKGVYWDVCEILRDQENYRFEKDESSLQMLADLIGCKDEKKFLSWFNDSVKFGLFSIEKEYFISPALSEVMSRWEASKSNGSKGGRPKKETEKKPRKNLTNNLTNNLDETIIVYNSIEYKIEWSKLLNKFNSITGKKSRVVPEKAKKAIVARLKEGYTKQDILNAIQNCYNDSHHKETNHKYLTLEFISRPDKLEKFATIIKPEDKPVPTYKDEWR